MAKLKAEKNSKGRTIHVADKDLNCAQNVAFAKQNGEGYLFAKSASRLPTGEKAWVLHDEGFQQVKAEKGKL